MAESCESKHWSGEKVQLENPMEPIYKKLSIVNGEINRMTKQQIRKKLAELHIDNRGVKEVIKKRLKNFHRKREMAKGKIRHPDDEAATFEYLAVIDFEATCEETNSPNYKHEIIEFPIVLVDIAQKSIVHEFHSYVRPTLHPKLSDFCTTLTGIQQETVDSSDTFPVVMKQVEEWIATRELGTAGRRFSVLTDGPWDMSRFLHTQCTLSESPFPKWGTKWINIKKSFSNFYGFPRYKLAFMLDALGMNFEGNQHSGIDDARNIARIAIQMLKDGGTFRQNERIIPSKLRKMTLGASDLQGIRKSSDTSSPSSSGEEEDNYVDCQEEPNETVRKPTRDNRSKVQQEADETVPKLTKNGRPRVSRTTKQLSRLSIEEDDASDNGDNLDDLLSYYALQKSRTVRNTPFC